MFLQRKCKFQEMESYMQILFFEMMHKEWSSSYAKRFQFQKERFGKFVSS